MAEIISVLILVTVLGVVCLMYRDGGRGNGQD